MFCDLYLGLVICLTKKAFDEDSLDRFRSSVKREGCEVWPFLAGIMIIKTNVQTDDKSGTTDREGLGGGANTLSDGFKVFNINVT